MATAGRMVRGEAFRCDVDAVAHAYPCPRGDGCADLRMLIAGAPCGGGGEESELLVGASAQERVHLRSIRSQRGLQVGTTRSVDSASSSAPHRVPPRGTRHGGKR